VLVDVSKSLAGGEFSFKFRFAGADVQVLMGTGKEVLWNTSVRTHHYYFNRTRFSWLRIK
jgi:hypothetical protein